MSALVVILAGLGAAVVVLLAATALSGLPRRARRGSATGRGGIYRTPAGRLVGAAAAGLATLAFTGWPVASAGVVTVIVGYPALFPGRRADGERDRLEALATWLADLSSRVRGTANLSEALVRSTERPPPLLAGPLRRFGAAAAAHPRPEHALEQLADDLDHPLGDAAVAALWLALHAQSARPTTQVLDQLAAAARDEVDARRRVDRVRAVYQRSLRRLLLLTAGFVAYLVLAAPDLVAPYATPAGQLWLLAPLGVWAACAAWLGRMSRYELPRYRLDLAVLR